MTETARKFEGLSGMQLKQIMLVLMVLDHIHYMFSSFAPIPGWFTMLGRLVAPTYLFLLVEGFHYTHSRPKFFLRVWVISFIMETVQFCMLVLGMWHRADGFSPANGIFMNYPLLFCMWQGIDWLRERRWLPGLAALLGPWFIYDVMAIPARLLPGLSLPLTYVGYAILPCWQFITDGGWTYLLLGLVLYTLRENRRLQLPFAALTMLATDLFYYCYAYTRYDPAFTWTQIFTNVEHCQWLSVFSVVLMVLYNGKRGKGVPLPGGQWLFYAFYPLHVYLLYGLSCLLYPVLTA